MTTTRDPTLEERRLKALSRLEAQVAEYAAGVRDGTATSLSIWKAREAAIRRTLDTLDELRREARFSGRHL